MKWEISETDNLAEAILTLKNSTEVKKFLRDLLTEPEIIELGKRWKAAQLLNNKVSYARISELTGLSSATVARVSQWLNRGKGGYQVALSRLTHRIVPSKK